MMIAAISPIGIPLSRRSLCVFQGLDAAERARQVMGDRFDHGFLTNAILFEQDFENGDDALRNVLLKHSRMRSSALRPIDCEVLFGVVGHVLEGGRCAGEGT